MRTAAAVAAGALGTLAVGGVVVGAFLLGRSTGGSAARPTVPTAPSMTAPSPSALRHAYDACIAFHRPNQISFDETRPVSDEEIRKASFEARSKAALAAGLDPRWTTLQQAIDRLEAANDGSGTSDAHAAFQRYFPVIRAQCLIAGAGDVNKADLVPRPAPT